MSPSLYSSVAMQPYQVQCLWIAHVRNIINICCVKLCYNLICYISHIEFSINNLQTTQLVKLSAMISYNV